VLQTDSQGLLLLADHVRDERDAILMEWSRVVKRDPNLTDGDSLPRAELYDHIPALLSAFELSLRRAAGPADTTGTEAVAPAAAHGLQRWQQGYDLREVTRELGALNKCVILELNRYAKLDAVLSPESVSRAHSLWANLCGTAIEESVSQYFALQQQEAAGHVQDLEHALEEVRELEQQRADQWHQAAHDLRGNLGVVAHVAVGLTRHGEQEASRQQFVSILTRNVTSLHQLLEDVTSLARLQAGREKRQIEPLDVTSLLQPLCEGIEPLAAQRGLTLQCQGPSGLGVDGDAVKIRRIAQNLILNAVKYTHQGGVVVTWGDSRADDSKRWLLTIQDTGQGIHSDAAAPIAAGLDPTGEPVPRSDAASISGSKVSLLRPPPGRAESAPSSRSEGSEGIGLSIVKRLCEMLDAKIEMESVQGRGTTFRILFPRHYAS
jgi:signal transduction histidine kinase